MSRPYRYGDARPGCRRTTLILAAILLLAITGVLRRKIG